MTLAVARVRAPWWRRALAFFRRSLRVERRCMASCSARTCGFDPRICAMLVELRDILARARGDRRRTRMLPLRAPTDADV